jgi:hypothetical protein
MTTTMDRRLSCSNQRRHSRYRMLEQFDEFSASVEIQDAALALEPSPLKSNSDLGAEGESGDLEYE